MIETDIVLLVNRKTDFELIKQVIIDQRIQSPVYIREYENHYQINITSEYEEWELDSAILESFPEYEFTSDLGKGRKEIRLELSRYQSLLSTDDWGRPIRNPLDETKYLVKKSNRKSDLWFNPEIKILFEDNEQNYHIHIIDGINKATGEKGFLLLKEFKNNVTNETEFFTDVLYKTPHDAFNSGYQKIQKLVNNDFNEYAQRKKKKLKDVQKLPRKIVREFINACNKSDKEGILKKLSPHISFEKLVDRQMDVKTEGLEEFKEYLDSPSQDLCGMDFKIRSSWDIKLSTIIIGLKYFPTDKDEAERREQLRWVRFLIEGNKIVRIVWANQYLV